MFIWICSCYNVNIYLYILILLFYNTWISLLQFLTLHCYYLTLWQAWCFLELLWTRILNLLPWLSWSLGLTTLTLLCSCDICRDFALKFRSLHTGEEISKGLYVIMILMFFAYLIGLTHSYLSLCCLLIHTGMCRCLSFLLIVTFFGSRFHLLLDTILV